MNEETHFSYASIISSPVDVRSNEVALFVTHSADGTIKPHVEFYVKSLQKLGIQVVLIVAVADVVGFNKDIVKELCDDVIIRENCGYDFSAWAHGLTYLNSLPSGTLLLLNDSIVGPSSYGKLHHIMEKIRESSADFISATLSLQITTHAQSFFMVFKGEGLNIISEFMSNVVTLDNKFDVTLRYELPLLNVILDRGCRYEALFQTPADSLANPSLHYWDVLYDAGFPFIKAEVLRRMPANEWPEFVKGNPILESSAIKILNLYGVLPPLYFKRVKFNDGSYVFYENPTDPYFQRIAKWGYWRLAYIIFYLINKDRALVYLKKCRSYF